MKLKSHGCINKTLWMFLLSYLFFGMLLSPMVVGAEKTKFDKPQKEIQQDLTRLFGCSWVHSGSNYISHLQSIMGSVVLSIDITDNTIESIEITADVSHYHRSGSEANVTSRETVSKIFKYFLPYWGEREVWLAHAIDNATKTNDKQIVDIGEITVSVEALQVADLDDTYEKIIISKKKSFRKRKASPKTYGR